MQLCNALGYLWLVVEVRLAVDEAGDFDQLGHEAEGVINRRALGQARGLDACQHHQAGQARVSICLLDSVSRADLAESAALTVLYGDLASRECQVACGVAADVVPRRFHLVWNLDPQGVKVLLKQRLGHSGLRDECVSRGRSGRVAHTRTRFFWKNNLDECIISLRTERTTNMIVQRSSRFLRKPMQYYMLSRGLAQVRANMDGYGSHVFRGARGELT